MNFSTFFVFTANVCPILTIEIFSVISYLVTRYSTIPESSRKAKLENSQRLLETLQQTGSFYGHLGLQNGIKSMTSRQFIQALEYFIKAICGKDLQALSGKGDVNDAIIQFLKKFECPLLINKSMLKTPNTPHTFDVMVSLLLWLSEYTAEPLEFADPIAQGQFMLPNEQVFSLAAMNGFELWNKESDEFVVLQDKLVDNYISEAIHNNISSAEHLIEKTKKLRVHSIELRQTSTTIPNEQYLEDLESKFLIIEQQLADMTNFREEVGESLAKTLHEWDEKNNKLAEKQQRVNNVKETLHHQNHSRSDLDGLAKQAALLNTTISIINAEMIDVKAVESAQAINRARSLNDLTKMIPHVNKLLDELIGSIKQTNMKIDENVLNGLWINSSISAVTIQSIETIDRILDKIGTRAHDYLPKLQFKKDQTTVEISSLKKEKALAVKQLKELREKHRKYMAEIEVLNGVLKMNEKKCENVNACVSESNTAYTVEISGKKNEIANLKERVEQGNEKIRQLMEEGERDTRARIAGVHNAIAEIDELDAELDEMFGGLLGSDNESDAKRSKPNS